MGPSALCFMMALSFAEPPPAPQSDAASADLALQARIDEAEQRLREQQAELQAMRQAMTDRLAMPAPPASPALPELPALPALPEVPAMPSAPALPNAGEHGLVADKAPPTATPKGDTGLALGDASGERTGFGEAIEVRAGEVVSDAVAFGADVVVFGTVRGDATSFGGNVRIKEGGKVLGDAVAFGGKVEVGPEARVGGDRVAFSLGRQRPKLPRVHVESRAQLHGFGDEPHVEPTRVRGVDVEEESAVSDFISTAVHRFVLWLSLAGAGVLTVGLFPARVTSVAHALQKQPLMSAGLGLTAVVSLLIFAALFFVVTFGLGTPVSLLIVATLGVAWLLGFIGLCQVVGDQLPFQKQPHGRWVAFLVGTLLFTGLSSLPWVGWLVVAAASVLAVGGAITSRFGGVPVN